MPDQGVTTSKYVLGLDEVGLADAGSVGGKAANLGEMTRLKLAVPPGFVITTGAYLETMQESGIRSELYTHRVPDAVEAQLLSDQAKRLRGIVLDAPLPDAVRHAITDAYHRLGDSIRVAVRSSAPAEDAADTSFAGIHDSYTNVSGDDPVLDAVRRCWASLWSERALSYRAARGYGEEPSVAVVVQTMVPSDRSGVAFTADPRSGTREHIVIEAARGLGEVVVGGQVEPDTYTVDKDSGALVDMHLGAQAFQIHSDSVGESREEIAPDVQRQRVLDDRTLRRVAELATVIEKSYDAPQDLEFAIAGDDLWVVQTRPITTLGMSVQRGPIEEASPSGVLATGLGAGPGIASGQVRVLTSPKEGDRLQAGDVLVAPMTRPDWIPILRRAAAIVTDRGGITCHAAIVGRELGLPVVVGARNATSVLTEGQMVTVDGNKGVVVAGADSEDRILTAPVTPAPTAVGVRVGQTGTATAIYVNLASPDTAEDVAARAVDGVGLLRAEFMITEALGGKHPNKLIEEGRRDDYIESMAEGVGRIAAAFSPRPVIYRAVDLRSNEFANLDGGESEPVEENPMIGYRGCFRYIREPDLFGLDLDVLHRVRQRFSNVHLMIPFVRTRWELVRCLELVDAHPLGQDRRMLRWIMAEVPSVTHWLEEYARLGIDGLSIGTNDLTQLVLGVDRDSGVCEDLFDTMDPAVLATIDLILDRARAVGMTTSLCGQAVSSAPALAEHLVRRGITSVSVTPDSVEQTRRTVDMAERRILLEHARIGDRPGE
ncbi:phosphoenolpyruvate synthase [Rhodococcus sp. UNC363MFTsu5.1]|uniref:phosphoenolpyruvate synthase n=1 Tax=Rhodococcus sp. UNC363MFTsu5.1 TaxID=1449069 RepID=UPI00056463B0|nr:phosphoenolpyruvate synthase [Rhodococcus sp. UNC363MFTsu5.1]